MVNTLIGLVARPPFAKITTVPSPDLRDTRQNVPEKYDKLHTSYSLAPDTPVAGSEGEWELGREGARERERKAKRKRGNEKERKGAREPESCVRNTLFSIY